MPARDAHLQQARDNRAHAEWLNRVNPDDATARQWLITAAFYCSVHCIEAHLARHDLHCRSHLDRRAAMADLAYNVPGTVYFTYTRLEEWSRGARYDLVPCTPRRVEEALRSYLPIVTAFVGL